MGKQVFTNNLLIGGSYGSFLIPNALAFNSWQLMAMTISGTSVTVYRNGVQIGTGTLSSAPDNIVRSANYLGRASSGSFQSFYGGLQESTFYPTALSATTLSNHYSANGLATLNRNSTAGGAFVFQLDGVSNAKIDGLALTGGVSGLSGTSGVTSANDTLSNSYVLGNASNGIDLFNGSGVDNFTLTGNTIYANGGYGFSAVGTRNTVLTNNLITANGGGGVNIFTLGATVTGNQITANAVVGINVGTNDISIPVTVSNNVIANNSGTGISDGDTTSVISNNTVYGQTGSGAFGIYGRGLITGNTVYGNNTGIQAFSGDTATGNRVYNNIGSGIYAGGGSNVIGNFVYSNGAWGITGAGQGNVSRIANNIVYANVSGGMEFTSAVNISILNNTVYQLTGSGIRLDVNQTGFTTATPFLVENNIIQVGSGNAYVFDDLSFPAVIADYNDIFVSGSGGIGSVAGRAFTSDAGWIDETALDAHSIYSDPQFVNPPGGWRAGYSGGVDHGADDNFKVQSTSPTIDAGVPVNDIVNETVPDGARANQGDDGNTSSALASPAKTVQVLSPSRLQKLQAGTPYNISWMTTGLLSTQTVTEVNVNGGAVGLWNASEYATNGQQQLTFSNPVDTSGVTDPAPNAVYQSMSYTGPGVGNSLNYQIPVPNGTYTIRLDFAVPFNTSPGSQVFDINLQGQTVKSGYDAFVAAGDQGFKATQLTFAVTASGGSGIALQIVADTFVGAILSGFRVSQAFAGGAATQTANVQVSTDNGANWTTVATNQPLDVEGRGSFTWTPSAATNGATAMVRVVANDAANTTSATSGPFLIAPAGNVFYVNGSSSAGSITTAGGSDANDGKSPATPMSSIQAVLNAYHPGAGQTIRVDSGMYNMFATIVLNSADNGLTIQGVSNNSTILNRGNTTAGDYVFDLRNISNLTLDHLSITGGYAGINATNGTTNTGTTISNDSIYSNYQYEIATNGQSNWTVSNNSVHDTIVGGGIGFYFPNDGFDTFSNNTAFNNSGFGFFVQTVPSQPTTISGNTASANGTGIYATGPTTVSNNTAFSNGTYGFDIESGTLATGNLAYKQTGTNAAGVYVSGGELRTNTIYGNFNGITSSNAAAFIDRNKIYSNTNFGINMANAGSPTIFDNLVYANSGPAISLNSTGGTGYIIGNTVYETTADAVRLTSAEHLRLQQHSLDSDGLRRRGRLGEPGNLQCRLQRSVHDRWRQSWILEQRPTDHAGQLAIHDRDGSEFQIGRSQVRRYRRIGQPARIQLSERRGEQRWRRRFLSLRQFARD